MQLLLAVLASIGCAILAASALSVPSTHVLHEKRDLFSNSSPWIKRSRISADSVLPVRIGLTQSNLNAAHDHLMRISDPSSPDYGKHWTSQQSTDFFQPSNETVATVKQWLAENGIKSVTHSDNKGWLAFDAPTSLVEALLHTEYYEHESMSTGGVMPACDEYYVPLEIQEHIDYISPGIKLSSSIDAPVQGGMEHRMKTSMYFLYLPSFISTEKPALTLQTSHSRAF